MNKKQYKRKIKVPKFDEAAGFYTTPQRSRLMSNIKSKDTKPELIFRKALHEKGIRYRVNFKKLPGTPDISNVTKMFVVFIDGEFWHGYNWEQKKIKIKSNRDFWIPKIERNMQRDLENNELLKRMGFKVFRFWEQSVRKDLGSCLQSVINYIESL